MMIEVQKTVGLTSSRLNYSLIEGTGNCDWKWLLKSAVDFPWINNCLCPIGINYSCKWRWN